MRLKLAILACLATIGLTTAASAAPISLYGYNFTSYADSLISSTGSFSFNGASLDSSVTDADAATYAFSSSAGASLTLGFSAGILNSAGTDLVLFEIGTPDTFAVTINGNTANYLSVATGFSLPGGFGVNAVQIDLSSFGLGSGASINSILLGMDIPNGNTVPTLGFAGALNTAAVSEVPEPFTLSLFGAGFAGIAAMRRRKKAA